MSVTHEGHLVAIEPPAKCQHVGCGQPGTVSTVLVDRRSRRWELHHCATHGEDGVQIARATSLDVLPPFPEQTPRRPNLSIVQ